MLFNSIDSLFEPWLKENLDNILIFLNNPVFNTDSYKLSHKNMEPEGTEVIYSNLTPRFNKYFKDKYPNSDDKVVFFGLQPFLIEELNVGWKKYFFDQPLEQVMEQLGLIFFPYIGLDKSKLKHFEELHNLGYLPLRIKALPEGTTLNLNIPVLTVENTNTQFSFLTNYIESVLSYSIYKPMTVATIAREFSKLADKWWDLTVTDQTFKKFAIHDFSLRGHDGTQPARVCGAAALLYSNGTDNVPGYVLARTLYGGDDKIAFSVSASEHSVTTLGINFYKDLVLTGEIADLVAQLAVKLNELGLDHELEQAKGELITIYRLLTERYPEGILSYVSDSYDYWRVVSILLPILAPVLSRRNGKLVVRPDSGDPVRIIAGYVPTKVEYQTIQDWLNIPEISTVPLSKCIQTLDGKYYVFNPSVDNFGEFNVNMTEATELEVKGSIQVLSEIFGTTTNSKGFKELPPQIGLIYGDGITYQRATQIYEKLSEKGFAASNVVFGVGSYTFAANMSRDDLGIAVKATNAVVNGKVIPIFKEPKTGDGSKKSAKGYLKVDYNDQGEIVLYSDVTQEEADTGLLQVVFENSELFNLKTFNQIKTKLG